MSVAIDHERRGFIPPSEPVTGIQSMDVIAARRALEEARFFVSNATGTTLPSLEAATALSLYNGRKNRTVLPAFGAPTLTGHLEEEILASHPSDPRPTVGVELEIPKLPLPNDRPEALVKQHHAYATFFEALGFSANKHNVIDEGVVPPLWEVGLQYSFGAGVQSWTIAELIKTGIIPTSSLASSEAADLPNDMTSQDRFPVKMHMSFALPHNTWFNTAAFRTDAQILAGTLALGYSSPTILGYEQLGESTNVIDVGSAEPSLKHRAAPVRLEFRPFEVYDEKTFEVIEAAQLLAIPFIAAHTREGDPSLVYFWRYFVDNTLKYAYPEEMHNFETPKLGHELSSRSALEARYAKDLQRKLRTTAAMAAQAVAEHLHLPTTLTLQGTSQFSA